MIYSPLAVGHDVDGKAICTTCMAEIDPETGRCADAQAVDRFIAEQIAERLDGWLERLHASDVPPSLTPGDL